MNNLPESWDDLVHWVFTTPEAPVSENMRVARLVMQFHCDAINGGICSLLHDDSSYPHAELVQGFRTICGEAASNLIQEGVDLVRRPNPRANLPKDVDRALLVANDSVSKGADLSKTLKDIASVWPEISSSAGTQAYHAAVAYEIYLEPFVDLNRRYFEVCDNFEVDITRYADAFAAEWRSQIK